MRIILDANIIISIILFPKSILVDMVKNIVLNENLILCQYTINEIKDIFIRKFPNKINEMELFLNKIPYELFIYEETSNNKYPNIRDINDLPVLINAIESKSDILITGDKDFYDVKIKKPRIMKPRDYIDEYMQKELH